MNPFFFVPAASATVFGLYHHRVFLRAQFHAGFVGLQNTLAALHNRLPNFGLQARAANAFDATFGRAAAGFQVLVNLPQLLGWYQAIRAADPIEFFETPISKFLSTTVALAPAPNCAPVAINNDPFPDTVRDPTTGFHVPHIITILGGNDPMRQMTVALQKNTTNATAWEHCVRLEGREFKPGFTTTFNVLATDVSGTRTGFSVCFVRDEKLVLLDEHVQFLLHTYHACKYIVVASKDSFTAFSRGPTQHWILASMRRNGLDVTQVDFTLLLGVMASALGVPVPAIDISSTIGDVLIATGVQYLGYKGYIESNHVKLICNNMVPAGRASLTSALGPRVVRALVPAIRQLRQVDFLVGSAAALTSSPLGHAFRVPFLEATHDLGIRIEESEDGSLIASHPQVKYGFRNKKFIGGFVFGKILLANILWLSDNSSTHIIISEAGVNVLQMIGNNENGDRLSLLAALAANPLLDHDTFVSIDVDGLPIGTQLFALCESSREFKGEDWYALGTTEDDEQNDNDLEIQVTKSGAKAAIERHTAAERNKTEKEARIVLNAQEKAKLETFQNAIKNSKLDTSLYPAAQNNLMRLNLVGPALEMLMKQPDFLSVLPTDLTSKELAQIHGFATNKDNLYLHSNPDQFFDAEVNNRDDNLDNAMDRGTRGTTGAHAARPPKSYKGSSGTGSSLLSGSAGNLFAPIALRTGVGKSGSSKKTKYRGNVHRALVKFASSYSNNNNNHGNNNNNHNDNNNTNRNNTTHSSYRSAGTDHNYRQIYNKNVKYTNFSSGGYDRREDEDSNECGLRALTDPAGFFTEATYTPVRFPKGENEAIVTAGDTKTEDVPSVAQVVNQSTTLNCCGFFSSFQVPPQEGLAAQSTPTERKLWLMLPLDILFGQEVHPLAELPKRILSKNGVVLEVTINGKTSLVTVGGHILYNAVHSSGRMFGVLAIAIEPNVIQGTSSPVIKATWNPLTKTNLAATPKFVALTKRHNSPSCLAAMCNHSALDNLLLHSVNTEPGDCGMPFLHRERTIGLHVGCLSTAGGSYRVNLLCTFPTYSLHYMKIEAKAECGFAQGNPSLDDDHESVVQPHQQDVSTQIPTTVGPAREFTVTHSTSTSNNLGLHEMQGLCEAKLKYSAHVLNADEATLLKAESETSPGDVALQKFVRIVNRHEQAIIPKSVGDHMFKFAQPFRKCRIPAANHRSTFDMDIPVLGNKMFYGGADNTAIWHENKVVERSPVNPECIAQVCEAINGFKDVLAGVPGCYLSKSRASNTETLKKCFWWSFLCIAAGKQTSAGFLFTTYKEIKPLHNEPQTKASFVSAVNRLPPSEKSAFIDIFTKDICGLFYSIHREGTGGRDLLRGIVNVFLKKEPMKDSKLLEGHRTIKEPHVFYSVIQYLFSSKVAEESDWDLPLESPPPLLDLDKMLWSTGPEGKKLHGCAVGTHIQSFMRTLSCADATQQQYHSLDVTNWDLNLDLDLVDAAYCAVMPTLAERAAKCLNRSVNERCYLVVNGHVYESNRPSWCSGNRFTLSINSIINHSILFCSGSTPVAIQGDDAVGLGGDASRIGKFYNACGLQLKLINSSSTTFDFCKLYVDLQEHTLSYDLYDSLAKATLSDKVNCAPFYELVRGIDKVKPITPEKLEELEAASAHAALIFKTAAGFAGSLVVKTPLVGDAKLVADAGLGTLEDLTEFFDTELVA